MAGKKTQPNGTELAVAYVSLTVDASKVGQEVEEELGKAGDKGGKAAGKAAGEGLSKELKDKVKVGAAAAGAAAGAALVVGLHEAAAQADLSGTIQAQLGTTPEYAKEIADAAGKAYADGWGESLDDVGKTAAGLGQILNELGDAGDIADLTAKSTALAKQFDQDTGAIANSAAQLVRTGMAGTVDEAMNLITKGFQSNTKLGDDFLDSIDEYGVQFKELGLNGAEGLNIFNQAMRSGARDSDYVSDTLKEYVIRGKEMKKETAEAFGSIGLDAGKMQKAIAGGGPDAKKALTDVTEALRATKDPVLQNAAAVAIFGGKAEDLQDSLFAIDPAAATQGVGELAGTADEFVKNSMGMEQQLDSITRTLTQGLATALTPLLPQLQELATVGLEFFRWLGENPMITQIMLGIALAIAAIAAAQWVWNAAALANPMTWIMLAIIAVIVLVVAAVWGIASNWSKICFVIGDLWNGLMGWIGDGLGWLGARIGEVFGGIGSFIGDVFNNIHNGGRDALNWIIGRLNDLIGLLNTASDGLKKVTGIDLGHIGSVPGLATGGTVTGSGTVMVGEAGPELLNLPHGASVVPLDHPAANLGARDGSGASVTINNINPVAERSSESTLKAGQYLGAVLV